MATTVEEWRSSLRQRVHAPSRLRASSVASSKSKLSLKRRKKPRWDDTVTDLSVFKSSPAELARRHEIHKPKQDKDRIKKREPSYDYDEKENETPDDFDTESFQNTALRKRAIIKEIFYNQEKELQHVLRETDRTINQVKDMFGDEPRIYKSMPKFTSAPQSNFKSSFAHIDDDIVHPKILNDEDETIHSVEETDSDDQETETTGQSQSHDNLTSTKFNGGLNLAYYQNLLNEEEKRQSSHQHIDSRYKQTLASTKFTQLDEKAKGEADGKMSRNSKSAQEVNVDGEQKEISEDTNATACNHTRSKPTSDAKPHPSNTGGGLNNLHDLQDVLQMIETEMDGLEQKTGKPEGNPKLEKTKGAVTGFTVVILNTMLRLLRYVKQSELQRQADVAVMNSMRQDLEEQKILVDALTAELIDTQEQMTTLVDKFFDTRLKDEQCLRDKKVSEVTRNSEAKSQPDPFAGLTLEDIEKRVNESASELQEMEGVGNGITIFAPNSIGTPSGDATGTLQDVNKFAT